MGRLLFVVVLIGCTGSLWAQDSVVVIQESSEATSYRQSRKQIVIKQVVVGCVSGLGLGFLGGTIGGNLANCDDDEWFCGLGEAVIGGGLGLTVGSALGVYAMGARNKQKGSFGMSLLGSIAGLGSGILLTTQSTYLWPSVVIGPAIFSTAFYWMRNQTESRTAPDSGHLQVGPFQKGRRGMAVVWRF